MKRALKGAARLLQIAVTALLALLLACNLYLILMQRVGGVPHPTIFGYSLAVIASGSMEPALAVDDVILNHAQDSYQVGDVVTYEHGASLTTHRIVEITDDGYITQGDANNAPDPDPVQPEDVVGRVVGKIPRAGAFFALLRTPLGMTLLLFAGLLLLEFPLLTRGRDTTEEKESDHEKE